VDQPVPATPPDYLPPPPFAPPALRVAPLNETQVLGRTSYPNGPYAPPPTAYQPSAYPPPITWHPTRTAQRNAGSRRRVTMSFVTAGVAVVALVAIVTVLVGGATDHTARSLSVPDSVDEYTRISTISGSELRGLFGQGGVFGTVPADDLAAAKVAVYGQRDDSQPSGTQLRHDSADQVTSDVLDGAGSTGTPLIVNAGPLGGALKCANLSLDGEQASAGVWADDDTLGIVLIIDSTITQHTSTVTRDLRAKAEH
jgi:hypothetical protein